MTGNFGVEWARAVIARTPGRPGTIPVAQRTEALADLAAAYQVLAEQAQADNQPDDALAYRELAEHYGWLADRWHREGDLP